SSVSPSDRNTTRGFFSLMYSIAVLNVGASYGSPSHTCGVSAFKAFSNSSREVIGVISNGSYPAFTGNPHRPALTIAAITFHAPNAATCPSNPGCLFNHSSTVTFGFGTLSFELIR